MPELFHDDFTAAAGVLHGRVAPSGPVWADNNDALRLDGSSRLIRTPALEGTSTGSYAQVDAGASITSMWADISFTGASTTITENGGVVLIVGPDSARNGTPPAQGIFHNAIHAVFGCWQAAIALWENDVAIQPNAISYTYPGGKLALDGTVYRIRIYLDGHRLGVQMPDGAMKWAADPRVQSYGGRHLIYQVYNVTAPNLRPRIEEVWADNAALAFGDQTGRELVY